MINETAQKVSKAIEVHGEKPTRVALKAGIARNTFMRKLNGGTEFGVYELVRIAAAIGVHPSELLPKPYLADVERLAG
ncbi:helix-turn-helix domain-containing protein [Glutamicibacter sp. X7]